MVEAEEREMQEVLARFAEEDVEKFWGTRAVSGLEADDEREGRPAGEADDDDDDDDEDDLGVVVSRGDETAVASHTTAVRTTVSASELMSGPGGPLYSTLDGDVSSTPSPASVAAPMDTLTPMSSTAIHLLNPKSMAAIGRYTSKIRSSPLTLANPDLESIPEAEAERPTKRKQAPGHGASANTSAVAPIIKKKIRTAEEKTATTKKKRKTEGKEKPERKAKNAIDDLFAGLA